MMDLMLRRRELMTPQDTAPKYAVDRKTNAPLMDICYAQGWAANEDYMTFEEANNVTAIVSSIIQYNNNIKSLNELAYFPNMATDAYAFRNCSNLETIKLRNSNFSNTTVRQYFLYCYKLKTIDFGEHYAVFGSQTFTRCDAIETLIFRYDGIVTVGESDWNNITDTLKTIAVPAIHYTEYKNNSRFGQFNIITTNEYDKENKQ